MPIYEYQCGACGHELEKLQRMSDDQLTDCPDCGKPDLRRLVSAAGFRLKGAGWYETDFKKGRKKNLHGSHEPGKGKSKADSGGDKAPAGGAQNSKSEGNVKSASKPSTSSTDSA